VDLAYNHHIGIEGYWYYGTVATVEDSCIFFARILFFASSLVDISFAVCFSSSLSSSSLYEYHKFNFKNEILLDFVLCFLAMYKFIKKKKKNRT
jgi:hypothetical protein